MEWEKIKSCWKLPEMEISRPSKRFSFRKQKGVAHLLGNYDYENFSIFIRHDGARAPSSGPVDQESTCRNDQTFFNSDTAGTADGIRAKSSDAMCENANSLERKAA